MQADRLALLSQGLFLCDKIAIAFLSGRYSAPVVSASGLGANESTNNSIRRSSGDGAKRTVRRRAV